MPMLHVFIHHAVKKYSASVYVVVLYHWNIKHETSSPIAQRVLTRKTDPSAGVCDTVQQMQ